MPVQKFRTLQEAEEALWCTDPDDDYLERQARWWAIVRQMEKRSFPTGVFKYRSIEEADEDRERWERSREAPL